MDFTWDHNKSVSNRKKHGVSFELAERVFGDPYHLARPDPYPYQARWQVIGMPYADSPSVLFVVHTEEDENGVSRIISARRASA